MEKYAVLDHRTDLKIKIFGRNKKELFENACLAMFESILPKKLNKYFKGKKGKKEKELKERVEVKGDNIEELLVNFLSEVLYFSDVNDLGYRVRKVETVSDKKVKAELLPVKIPAKDFKTEIKAVTYYDMEVKKEDDLFNVVILFDI